MRRDALRALGLLLCLGGCASQAAMPGPTATSAVVSFPAPDQTPGAEAGEYRAKAGDSLEVTVFREPDMARSGQISSAGLFTMPPIGPIEVAGKTSAEIAESIRSRLTPDYLRDPQVTVAIKAVVVPDRITIVGTVQNSGNFEVDHPMNLTQAMATARGPAPGADLHHVVVFRKISGQRTAGVFDYDRILKGQDPDPTIYPDDEINVPSNGNFNNWKAVIGALPFLTLFRGL